MSKKTNKSYEKLREASYTANVIEGITFLLSWDQEIFMPEKAASIRGKQLEILSGAMHKEKTSPAFGQALEALVDLDSGQIKATDLDEREMAAVREWRRDYLQQVKLPCAFVEELANANSGAIVVWQKARPKSDFNAFRPHLEKLIELNRKKADLLGYEDHPYDALIDTYEPDMRVKLLTPLFERLKISLTSFLKKIQTKPDPDTSFLSLDYDHGKQLAFGKKVLSDMGFNEGFSRLDESAHPMCLPVHPTDTRMTTRIYPNNPTINILSCAHEGGHGLYHSHLLEDEFGTPLGQAASFGIDESQSRTWETIVGRSKSYWEYYFPQMQEAFPENLKGVTLEQFYRAINLVEPSLIRTDSDEVSYNLHIMVRYEIEKGFIEGKYQAADLPDLWEEKMRDYLGISPKMHSEGCLQDIHWSMGAFGYFPTYCLGNLYAAQFFEAFVKDHPNWQERIKNGEFAFLSEWQKEHIHQHGRRYTPVELCKRVSGAPLSEEPFMRYLESKYKPLYEIS